MTSRNSFSEAALLRDGMRRNLWGTVLATISFVMTLLLPVLMMMQNTLELQKEFARTPAQSEVALRQWQNALNSVSTLLGGGNAFVKLAFLALAVVCGVSAFAYLHSRQKVDLYHALPISRTRLFATNFATGILCVLSSYVIVLALSVAAAFAMGFGEAVEPSALMSAVASNLIVFLLVYALSALAAIVCGQTIISLLLLLWMLFGGATAYGLFGALCDKFYETFAYGTMTLSAMRLSPPIQYFLMNGKDYMNGAIGYAAPNSTLGVHLAYLAAAVLVTALACLLFRIRKSERAGSALAFDPAKLPVKVLMCLVIGAAAGVMFSGIVNDFWFWPGVVIGVVLWHWLVEIIYAFDFRAIFSKPLHLVCILAALTVLLLCMKADVTGYDTWLPEQDVISAVDLDAPAYGAELALQTPQNIAAVRRLAELGLLESDPESGNAHRSLVVSYQMQSGSVKQRQYTVEENEETKALLTQIYASEEFKRARWALFTYDPAALQTPEGKPAGMIGVKTEQSYDWQATLRGDNLVRVLDTLRAEALTRPDGVRPVLSLDLTFEEIALYQNYAARGSAAVTEADFQTLALIAELTGVTPERLAPEQFETIVINYWGRDEEGRYLEGRQVVSDAADIAAMLRDAINIDALGNYGGGNEYLSGYELEQLNGDITAVDVVSGNSYTLNYPKGKAPTDILAKYPPTVQEDTAGKDSAMAGTMTVAGAEIIG